MAIHFQPVDENVDTLDPLAVSLFLHRVRGLPEGIEILVHRDAYRWRVKVIHGSLSETWIESFSTLNEVKTAIERRLHELQE